MSIMQIHTLLQKLLLKPKQLKRILENSYLCLKYPFLYPKNRFDGKHHAYILQNLVYKLNLKATREIGVGIKHIKKDSKIPNSVYESFLPGLFISVDEDTLWVKYNNETQTVNMRNYLNGKFVVRGFRVHSPYVSSGIYNIQIYVSQRKEDNTNWGFCYKRLQFIENSFLHKVSKKIGWIDKHILDKIFFLPKYTELDALDKGWRKAFGLQICEEIKQSLLKTGGRKALNNYRIMQIKEKFGELRWYDENSTKEVQSIINKYSDISYRTCIVCGKPAKYRSRGWICPYCEEHIESKEDADIINYGKE